MRDLVLSWLDQEILERPISKRQWGKFLLTLQQMQVHDAEGSIEWGVAFELGGKECFGTVDKHATLSFVSTDREDVKVVVDQTKREMTLKLAGGDECLSYTVNVTRV